eukprot:5773612-Prymnesium_polylepis.1
MLPVDFSPPLSPGGLQLSPCALGSQSRKSAKRLLPMSSPTSAWVPKVPAASSRRRTHCAKARRPSSLEASRTDEKVCESIAIKRLRRRMSDISTSAHTTGSNTR